jgi:Exportin-T
MVTTVLNQIKKSFATPIVNAQASALLAVYLEDSLFVLGSLSKGFPRIPDHLIEPFKQSLDVVVHIIRQVPARRVRMRALFVVRTLVGGLGETVFPFLPPVIESLMKDNHVQDLQAFLGFINQIGHRFKVLWLVCLVGFAVGFCLSVFEPPQRAEPSTVARCGVSSVRLAPLTPAALYHAPILAHVLLFFLLLFLLLLLLLLLSPASSSASSYASFAFLLFHWCRLHYCQ